MRIISGRFKGKSIGYLKSKITRPLKDSLKENIFNILMHSKNINIDIKNSVILDLYSGVGSFGLECISRGAKKVTFVEQDNKAFNVLSENLVKLSAENKAEKINIKIEDFLKSDLINKYNIFFLDPPFSDKEFIHNLKALRENKYYQSNHIVIIHREKSCIDDFDTHLKVSIVRNYGRSKIIFGKFI